MYQIQSTLYCTESIGGPDRMLDGLADRIKLLHLTQKMTSTISRKWNSSASTYFRQSSFLLSLSLLSKATEYICPLADNHFPRVKSKVFSEKICKNTSLLPVTEVHLRMYSCSPKTTKRNIASYEPSRQNCQDDGWFRYTVWTGEPQLA